MNKAFFKGVLLGTVVLIVAVIIMGLVGYGASYLFTWDLNITPKDGGEISTYEMWAVRMGIGTILLGWMIGMGKLLDVFAFGFNYCANPNKLDRKMTMIKE
mgnify:CR=1 FL=1